MTKIVGGALKLKGMPVSLKSKVIKKEAKVVAKPEAETTETHQMTETERKFKQIQLDRLKQRAQNKDSSLLITHRQKIEAFNKKLANLPEHNDIPKVGPG